MGRIVELEKENKRLTEVNILLAMRNAQLLEELKLALYRQFGRTSEKFKGQDDLPFEDLKPEEDPQTIEVLVVEAHQRRKKAGRKPLAASLPRVDHPHDLEEWQKQCACGHQMTQISEDVREKLAMVPMQIYVEHHRYPNYACSHCQGLSDESLPAVRSAPREADLIPRSIVSTSLLAHIWTAKFCDHLPYYRQEVGFARIGADISRQDMVNWTMKVSPMLKPLIELLDNAIREGPVIQMDETPVTVLKLDDTGKRAQGYMWLAKGGTREHPAVRYRFASGRGNLHAKDYLKDFSGFLQTDGYSGYDAALAGSGIVHVGCWAHARRKFVEADKVSPSNLSKDAIGRIKKLYELEKQARTEAKAMNLTDEAFVAHRKTLLEGYLKDLKLWMDNMAAQTLPSGATGKAIAYTAGQWDKLVRFLKHAWLTPDNNGAENGIRPFVVGRKNWLFHGNDEGAQASCRVYTLIETAKLNGLEPWAYLRALLEKLPSIRLSGEWDTLLPWNLRPGKI